MNKSQVYSNNLIAIKEILEAFKAKRIPNKTLLEKFNGYGGLKEILLDPNKPEEWNQSDKKHLSNVQNIFTTLEIFNRENTTAFDRMLQSLRSSTLTSYFTPEVLIESTIKPILKSYDGLQIKLLEPSCGKGSYFKVIEALQMSSNIELHGIEKDSLSSAVVKGLYPNANIQRTALETAQLGSNSFDIVASNIPFGSFKVYDSSYRKESKKSAKAISQKKVHTYFFTKGLDLVKPNGYVSFITSTGIADSVGNQYLREHIIKEATLISAIRLPNNTFEESGTKVNTDLLVLQKRDKALINLNIENLSEYDAQFLTSKKIEFSDHVKDLNGVYFDSITGLLNTNILGELGLGYFFDKEQIVFNPSSNTNTIDKIANLVSEKLELGISENVLKKVVQKTVESSIKGSTITVPSKGLQLSMFDSSPEVETQKAAPIKNSNEPLPLTISSSDWNEIKYYLSENDLYVLDDIPGRIKFSENGTELLPLIHKNPKEIQKYKQGILVTLAFKQLLKYETESYSKDIVESKRQELNTLFDNFRSDYGLFSSLENKIFIRLNPHGEQILGLEIYNEKTKEYDKADILNQSTFQSQKDVILGVEDAIYKSLNKFGFVSLEYTAEICNRSKDDIIKEGLDGGILFPNPIFAADEDFTKFEHQEKVKIEWGISESFFSGPVRHKVEQLEKYADQIPGYSTLKQIEHINVLKSIDLPWLGISDINPQLGESWLPLHVYEDFASSLFQTDVSITKRSSSHSFDLKVYEHSPILTNEFLVDTIQSRSSLNGKDLFLHAMAGTNPKITYSVKSGDSSRTYLDKKAMISASLKIDTIENEFSNFLLSNKALCDNLENIYNNTQNLQVNRVVDGSHLTFQGLENYELYQHQKDAVWQNISNDGGLNDHIVGAGKTLVMICTAMEMKRLGISNKTIITALKANTGEIYKDFLKAYPNSKVLCPNASDFTPLKRQSFFQKMANNDWDAIIMTHEQFGKIPQSREIQMEVLDQELENLDLDLNAMASDKGADKRQLRGLEIRKENTLSTVRSLIDSIEKDPNMLTFEKFGFGHIIVDESHEFKNLLYSTRFNRVAGLGPRDGSAKSLNMLFAIRTMQKQKGGDKGVTFCSGTPISNSLVELYTLMKYLTPSTLEKRGMPNFDSWARTYAKLSTEYELTVTNEIKVKERFRSFMKVPELSHWYRSFTNIASDQNISLDKPVGQKVMVDIEPSAIQSDYSKKLINAVQTEDFSDFGKSFDRNQLQAKMLIATNIATRISLDMRALDSTFDENAGSKLTKLSENVNQHYKDSHHFNGVQLVFCDIETPNSKNAKAFNAYDGLKNILVYKYGIPENEIQFIHSHDSTIKKKRAFFESVNDGKVRVVVGSSKKMGVGVNMQERIIAMHHLDIPWTPHLIEQREGRGVRQGNLACKKYCDNKLPIYTYATKGTLDAYKYYLVDLKQKFINQIKTNDGLIRTIDEGDMDESGSMSPSAFIARLSGKKELLEKNKIDQKIGDVQTKISVLKSDKRRAEANIKTNTTTIPKTKKALEHLKTDLILSNKSVSLNNNKPVFVFESGNQKIADTQKFGEFILKNVDAKIVRKQLGEHHLGSIGSFSVVVNIYNVEQMDNEKYTTAKLSLISNTTQRSYNYGTTIDSRPGFIARQIYNSLRDISEDITRFENAISKMEKDIISDTTILGKIDIHKFDKELDGLVSESLNLQRIIERQDEESGISTDIKELVYNAILDDKAETVKDSISNLPEEEKKELLEFITNHPGLTWSQINESKDMFNVRADKDLSRGFSM